MDGFFYIDLLCDIFLTARVLASFPCGIHIWMGEEGKDKGETFILLSQQSQKTNFVQTSAFWAGVLSQEELTVSGVAKFVRILCG